MSCPEDPSNPSKPNEKKALAAHRGRLGLLCLLRNELDDELLERMAEHDFGMDKAQNLKALMRILRTGEVPCPLPPEPGEICILLRWETVELDKPLSLERRRHHVVCLFASWILVSAYASTGRDQTGYTEEGDEIALQLLTATCVALGPAFVRASMRFIEWAQSEGAAAHSPLQNLFYLLSLLILHCASSDPEELAAAPAVYDRLVAEERSVRCEMSRDYSVQWAPEPPWLFGLVDFTPGGHGHPTYETVKWVKTALWVMNRLDQRSGGLDPRLAEFKQRLGLLALP